MASIIRIKRSATSGNPGLLGAGELAYSSLANNDVNGGDRLYIGVGTETNGDAANHIIIGGKYFTDMMDHTRGTLQADSALITDANSKIDRLNVDNLRLDGNTVSTTDTNGNLYITPNGSGKTIITNATNIDNVQVSGNTISTLNDNGSLVIRPITTNSDSSASQAIVNVDIVTGLRIPVGTTAQRPAAPVAGLIRYNTSISQFEGYNGTSYISIGGVRDVDGNTYIIPELSPGSNENTLFFYTDGVERMTLSTNALNVSSTIGTATFNATTASTTTSTGAVVVTGGVGIGGQLNVGGATNKFTANTASSSTTTGAVVVTGGVGVGGNLNVGGNTNITGSLTVATDGAPQAVSIESSTLTLESQQDASIGLSTNSATTYTATIRAQNSGTGAANMVVVAKSDLSIDSTTLSIDSTDTTNITMTANNASTKTLLIDATNAGAGEAQIQIGSTGTDKILLDTGAAGTVDIDSGTFDVAVTDVNIATNTFDLSTTGAGEAVNVTTADVNVDANTVDIRGKAGAGANAVVTITGELQVDNVNINGNTISTTDGSNTLYLDPAPVADNGGTVVIKGNLQVDGTTTTINSTQVTVDDPIFVLSGDSTPSADDNLDRGIEFKWHNGTAAKLGFFGYDDSASEFIFIPDADDTNSVVSGTLGAAAFGSLRIADTTASTTTTTGAIRVAGGVGIAGQLNVGGATSKFTATTAATSSTTGALVVAGGVGIGGALYVAGNFVGSGSGSSNLDGFNIDGGTY